MIGRSMPLALALALAALPPAVTTAGAEPPPDAARDWARRLVSQPVDRRLEIRLDDGRVRVGFPVACDADSVRLATSAGGEPAAAVATAEILAVRREASGAARGWSLGQGVGAAAGAVVGLLFAALVDAVEESGETQPVAYAGLAVGTATVGAVGLGGIGALLGSATDTWYELESTEPPRRPRQRLGLEFGLAGADDLDWKSYDALHVRVVLPRRLSGAVDLVPELTWSNLDRVSSDANGRTAKVGDTWSAGLAARVSPPGPGLAPYATVGAGWYGREDTWLGLNYGIGLRWRLRSGHSFNAEVRNHFRASDLDAEPTNGQVTATVGWTFGL